MKYLTVAEVFLIHEYEIQRYGGFPGLRSIELLESAVFRSKPRMEGKNCTRHFLKKQLA